MSVSELESELHAAEELARAARCLQLANEPVPVTCTGAIELAGLLRKKLTAAIEDERLAAEKQAKADAAERERQEGRALAEALRELAKRRELLAHFAEQREALLAERDELAARDEVQRFRDSDAIANRAGVGGVWASALKKLVGNGGNLRLHPAGWMTVAGPVPGDLPFETREAAANWPPALKWTPAERGAVCRWVALHDEIAAAQRQHDECEASVRGLLDDVPALRALEGRGA